MLCKQTTDFWGSKAVYSRVDCSFGKPTTASLEIVDRDVNGFYLMLRKGRMRVSRTSLECTRPRRLAGSLGTLNACTLKDFRLHDKDGDKNCLQTGNVRVALLASAQCDDKISTEMEDQNSWYFISDLINDSEREMSQALVDNEEELDSSGRARAVKPNTERSGQVSIPLVTILEKDLKSSHIIVPCDSKNVKVFRSSLHEGSTRGSKGIRSRGGGRFLMSNRSRVEEIMPGLLSALERADTMEKINCILEPALNLSASDLSLILEAVKPSERVVELFFWMKEKGKTITNFSLYKKVFEVLSKRQEWIMIESLLRDSVLSLQDETSCEVFNALFKACLVKGSSDWATKWFRLMVEQGIHPNSTSYSRLFSLYQRQRKLQEAEFVYQHMDKSGGRIAKAYSAMIILYSYSRQFEKLEQIFDKMMAVDVKPGKKLWLFRLDAFVRQGKVKESEKVMQQMQESGIRPNAIAYTSMITVNGKANCFKEAMDWLFRLEQEGLQPDAATYRCLIGACGRSGKLKEALNFYERMKRSGFLPNLQNFNSLIHLHRKVGNDCRILSLLSDMKQMDCCPDSSTLDAVVKVYERYGELEKISPALKLLQEAGWLPDEKSYGILLRAYIRCSLVEQALDAFTHLQTRAGMGETLCHTLICLCKAAGRYNEAIHVFLEMQRFGCQPSTSTTCTVIDIYNLKGAIEEGAPLFKELRSTGQQLDCMAYSAIDHMNLKDDSVSEFCQNLESSK